MNAHHFLNHFSGRAIIVNNNFVEPLYYGYTDNQVSLIALTDANRNVVEKYAFDPWGARRDPADWRNKDSRNSFIINRGYTGHEHLDAFGIINMNGRVYDPLTAMFFSPDPFVQEPGNWLNYNRYGYCLNNPLKYTDPSGYDWYNGTWYPDFYESTTNTDPFDNLYDQGKQFSFILYEVEVVAPKLESFVDRMNRWMDQLGYGMHPYDNQNQPENIVQPGLEDNVFNHTISDQTTIGSKYLSATFNSDVITINNPSNITTVTTNKHFEPISTTTGILTVGKDGSITVGSTVFAGLNITTGDYIFGINVPTGSNTSGGITISVNGAIVKGIGAVSVGVGIICTGPVMGFALLY